MGWRCPPTSFRRSPTRCLKPSPNGRTGLWRRAIRWFSSTPSGSKSGTRGFRNKAVYLALGVAADGTKDILGLWIETIEGAKFWLRVMNELKACGVEDILIAVVDGLKGFPEAIEAVFPQAAVQTCIVHLIRNSLDFVSWKDRKPVVAELRKIYRAADAEAGRKALEAFEHGSWGRKYAAIGQIWRRQWEQIIPFFAFAPAVRKIIYTTNAIEALNAKLRRAVRARGHFPNDEAATKLIFLVLQQVVQEWKMPPREWAEARTDRHGSWRSVQRVWPVGRSHPHYISQAASPDPIPRPRPFAARAVGRVGVLAFVDRETPAPDALRQAGAQSLKLSDPLIDPFRPSA